jgi:mxaA protein
MSRIGLRLGWALVSAVAMLGGPRAAPTPSLEASEPRAFGYQVGDLVERHVTLHAPPGWSLDSASLPRVGGRGQAFELRRVAVSEHAQAAGRRHEIDLQYQVFFAPTVVRTLEIPSFRLRLEGEGRTEELLVEAWPVTVAPLVPVDVSPRRGLGDLQPDRAAPRVDEHAPRLRLVLWAALAAALIAWLALLYLGPPWRAARNRPFGVAWRQLKRLPASPNAEEWRAACRQMHDALNRSAGEVLFEPGLDRFAVAQPAFSGLLADLTRFLQLSRREFFGEATPALEDAAWLVTLCKRCHDAERGLR